MRRERDAYTGHRNMCYVPQAKGNETAAAGAGSTRVLRSRSAATTGEDKQRRQGEGERVAMRVTGAGEGLSPRGRGGGGVGGVEGWDGELEMEEKTVSFMTQEKVTKEGEGKQM